MATSNRENLVTSDDDFDMFDPNKRHYFRLPDLEEQGKIVTALTEYNTVLKNLSPTEKANSPEAKISPKLEAANKKLYNCFASGVKNLVKVLCSEEAAILGTSVSTMSFFNTIMSTFPNTDTNDARLKAIAGGELFLYMVSNAAYAFSKKCGKNAPEKVEKIFDQIGDGSNGFGFLFGMLCQTFTAITKEAEVSDNATIAAALGSFFGASLGLAIFQVYGQTKAPDSKTYTAALATSFGVMMGGFFGNLFRLLSDSPDNPMQTTPGMQWSPILITLASGTAGTFFYKKYSDAASNIMTIISKLFGTSANIFYELGTAFQIIAKQDLFAGLMLGAKLIFLPGSYAIIKYNLPKEKSQNLSEHKPEEENKEEATSTATRSSSRANDETTDNVELQPSTTQQAVNDSVTESAGSSPSAHSSFRIN